MIQIPVIRHDHPPALERCSQFSQMLASIYAPTVVKANDESPPAAEYLV